MQVCCLKSVMKIICSLILFLFPLFLFAQEQRKVNMDQLEEKSELMYVKGEKAPFTGQCFTKYDDGTLGMAGTYKNGQKDGDWVWWYQNGEKKRICHYVSGLKDGKSIFYYKTGIKKSEIIFDNDRNIKQLSWDEKGNKTKNPSFEKFN
jgi:antitoxin component YwqK of YwqJK toxin-antitoxin module